MKNLFTNVIVAVLTFCITSIFTSYVKDKERRSALTEEFCLHQSLRDSIQLVKASNVVLQHKLDSVIRQNEYILSNIEVPAPVDETEIEFLTAVVEHDGWTDDELSEEFSQWIITRRISDDGI